MNYLRLHGIILTLAWLPLENVLIWILLRVNKKLSPFLHGIIGSFIIVLEIIGMLMLLLVSADFEKWAVFELSHLTLGFIGFLISPFIAISGWLCYLFRLSPSLSPKAVNISNKSHRYLGYFSIFLGKVPLVGAWLKFQSPFIMTLLVLDLFLHLAFLVFKLKKKSK